MKLILSILAVAVLALNPSKILAADVALVINNAKGAGFERERDIVNDFRTVLQAYRDDGFNVLTQRDANPATMGQMFRQFEAQSRDADRVVIHFVGDILPVRESYVFKPSGSAPRTIVDKRLSGFSIELAYDLLAHRPGRSALVLATPKGQNVAQNLKNNTLIPQGLLVVTGWGLLTNEIVRDKLLKEDATGRQIHAVKNVSASGFVSDLSLAAAVSPERSSSTSSSASAPNNATTAAIEEMRVWREAAQVGTQRALQGYLNRYPNGLFRGEAQARLDAVSPPKTIDQTIEEGLRLTRANRREIQKNLTTLGFNTRGVDGLFGPGTRRAVENWQRSEGFRSTGYLDGAQIRVLKENAAAKAAAERQIRERDDLAYWQSTGSGTNERGLREYLAKFPEGLFAAQAKQALARIAKDTGVQQNETFANREKSLGMTPQTRRLAEQRLAGLGYKVGPVDGNFTPETRVAIKQFQQSAGLTATGYLDNPTVTRLVASIFR